MKTQAERHFDPKYHSPISVYTVPLLIWDVLENSWGPKRVEFTQAFPTEKMIGGPRIVWKVYRRIPGREGLETLKPRARTATRSAANPDAYIDVWGQWHTVIYQFDIFATDNNTANDLVVQFEDLMFQITSTLKSAGVIDWFFDEQLIDTETQATFSQQLCRRTLRYRCILDKRYTRQLPSFKSIWIRPIAGDILVTNEEVTRSTVAGQTYDALANSWVSSILAVDIVPVTSTASSGCYFENVDFVFEVDLTLGEGRISWISGAKHPQPTEKYYVTYTYSDESTSVEVADPPRSATS